MTVRPTLAPFATLRLATLFLAPLGIALATTLAAPAARAAQCGGDFNTFLSAMARDAQAAGVRRDVIATAFAGVTLDQSVLAFDRRQHGTFRQSFERYASTRVTTARVKRGQVYMQRNAALLARI